MILDAIVAAKRAAHERRPPRSLDELLAEAQSMAPARPLRDALVDGRRTRPRAIAEFKRRSPSAGPIRPGADPAEVVPGYARAGAAAISVLTDEEFFDGRIEHLGRARAACALPVLRKDFLLDERDLLEARLAGADAALLIARLLPDGRLRALLETARAAGLEALVEVHDERELERALAAGADPIGVNHRDLDTLAIDLSLSSRLRRLAPPSVALVAESGLRGPDDVRRVADAGIDAILVGEALMRAPDPGAALRALLG